MNKLGRLNVDEFLQVKDVPDVYAIGDCNDAPEIKLAYGAETQGKYVADNLKLKHEGKDMKPYNVNSKFTCVCKDVHAFVHLRHCQQVTTSAKAITVIFLTTFIIRSAFQRVYSWCCAADDQEVQLRSGGDGSLGIGLHQESKEIASSLQCNGKTWDRRCQKIDVVCILAI